MPTAWFRRLVEKILVQKYGHPFIFVDTQRLEKGDGKTIGKKNDSGGFSGIFFGSVYVDSVNLM